jgi:AbrB family looped-hinge helix DNA binding protein
MNAPEPITAAVTATAAEPAQAEHFCRPRFTTVSTKGQVVIPAEIRHALGVEPGTCLLARVEDGRIVMVPSKKLTWRDLRGIGAGGPSMTDELLEERRKDLERETAEGW